MRIGAESVNIASTKQDILNSLKDREYRAAFNLENVYTTICFQLRALREQREMSQVVFGKQVKPKMAQERISILEDPNSDSKPTLNTLLRLAEGLDVGLEVRFVPFSVVLEHSAHTNFRELEVESFEDEIPRLEQAIAVEVALENSFSLNPQADWSPSMAAFYRPAQTVSPITHIRLVDNAAASSSEQQVPDTSWVNLEFLDALNNPPIIRTAKVQNAVWCKYSINPEPLTDETVGFMKKTPESEVPFYAVTATQIEKRMSANA
jgi:transcriptional regulator with XRE-family HTH domain